MAGAEVRWKRRSWCGSASGMQELVPKCIGMCTPNDEKDSFGASAQEGF